MEGNILIMKPEINLSIGLITKSKINSIVHSDDNYAK